MICTTTCETSKIKQPMLQLIIRNKKLYVEGHERKEENGTLLHLIVEGEGVELNREARGFPSKF